MGSFSIWHWLIVLVVVLLLFGRGKIPELMGDMAKGIKTFKKGMQDDEDEVAKKPAGSPAQPAAPAPIEHASAKPAPTADGTKAG